MTSLTPGLLTAFRLTVDRAPKGYRRQNLAWRTVAQKSDPQINNVLRESHRAGARHS